MTTGIRSLVIVCSSFVGVAFAASDMESAPAAGDAAAVPGKIDEVIVTLEVPLNSPLFATTPVAVVDDEPITFRDLTEHIASIHAARKAEKAAGKKDYADLLDRVITTQLIVQEARNMGLDETDEFRRRLDAFSEQLLISQLMSEQLKDVEADPAEVDALYRKMAREVRLSTVKFERERDALLFRKEYESGADFHDLARRVIEQGDATGEVPGEQYMELKDLVPQVAQTVFDMESGSVSQIFSASKGFLLFYVEDIRFYEDPALREEARQKVLAPLRRKKAAEFGEALERKYVTIDQKLFDSVSFEAKEVGFLWFRREKPVAYSELLADERVLATVHGDEPSTITVGDLAAKLEKGFFHGIDKALERKRELDEQKRITFKNMLFRRTARIEALRRGIDRREEYRDAVREHANSLLFEGFIDKVISPDVTISDEELRQYYQDHTDEFSTPKMLRMASLVFYSLEDAQAALAKLRKGADFQWVSANTEGQVDKDAQGISRFDNVVLSVTGLPEELRKPADRAKQGDFLLYSSSDGYHYVIAVQMVAPPEPQPYEGARRRIAELLTNQKIKDLIADWSSKLREAYETRIFVTDLPD